MKLKVSMLYKFSAHADGVGRPPLETIQESFSIHMQSQASIPNPSKDLCNVSEP